VPSIVQAELVTHEQGFYISMQSLIVSGHYVDLAARSELMPFEQIPDESAHSDALPLCNVLNPISLMGGSSYGSDYYGSDYGGNSNTGMQVFGGLISAVCTYTVSQSAYRREATLEPGMMFSLRLGAQGEGNLQAACVPSALRDPTVAPGSTCGVGTETLARQVVSELLLEH
jgi:hypothetical protein